ncbi:hypothetical protein ATY75_32375 [Rhizobium sp. N122]|nr:hypothetical protein ATY75_32375 [Rhizobium sp. N122]
MQKIKSINIVELADKGWGVADNFKENVKDAYSIAEWIALGYEPAKDKPLLDAVGKRIMISKAVPNYPHIENLDQLKTFFIWFKQIKSFDNEPGCASGIANCFTFNHYLQKRVFAGW